MSATPTAEGLFPGLTNYATGFRGMPNTFAVAVPKPVLTPCDKRNELGVSYDNDDMAFVHQTIGSGGHATVDVGTVGPGGVTTEHGVTKVQYLTGVNGAGVPVFTPL